MEDNIYKISYKLKKELQRKIFVIVAAIIFVFIFLTFAMNFILFPVMQRSVSMNPTISNPSVSFVCPLVRVPKRGDLMFLKPQSRQDLGILKSFANSFVGFFTGRQYFPFTTTRATSGTGTIRRVVALPGDTIYLSDYILHVKPKNATQFLSEFELSEMSYSIKLDAKKDGWDGQMGSVANTEEIVLGEDEYFVLGDNRNICSDSRSWGTIKSSSFSGKVLLTYLPIKQFTVYGRKIF